MNHPHDLLTDYLTGDLSAADARRVDQHLATCASCHEELARMDEALVAMVESLPASPPPARVWAAIEARTGAVATSTAEPAPPAGRTLRPGGATRDPAAPPPPIVHAPARPRTRAWVGGLAASLVLGAAALWWGFDQRQQLLQVQADLERTRTEQAALDEDQARLARWLSNDALVTRQIAEAEDSPIGSVLFLPNGRALVVMRDPPGQGSDFQAWGVQGGAVTSLGAFAGRTSVVSAEGFEAVAVSLEPDGGSATPTEVLGAVPTS